jgi:hypothetical protein
MTTYERRPAEAAFEVIVATETSIPQSSLPQPKPYVVSRAEDNCTPQVIDRGPRGDVLFRLSVELRVADRSHARGEYTAVAPVSLVPVRPVQR